MHAAASDSAEARSIANAIVAEIAAGTAAESIAVLYRINVQGTAIEAALGDAGVNFQLRNATRFFDLPEIKQALMLLKGASVTTVSEPLFKTVSDVLRSLGWTQEAPEVRGAVRDRWDSLNAVMTLAEQAPPATGLRDFVDDLFERQAGHHEPSRSAVTLSTIHAAKGLEWDSVYIAGLSEGLLPISYAKDEAAIDEERRLLYVGVTRARIRLCLSWAESSTGQRRSPSRFLADLQR